jgi:glutathione S-transferase
MSYTLYYSPGTASMAVHWMLLELEVPFDAVPVDFKTGAQREPAYLRLNPMGRVPVLVIDGAPVCESAALLMLLAERHPARALMPAPGTAERAAWLQQIVYLANTILPAMRDWFYADKDGEASGADAVRALARRRIEGAWELLNARLAAQTHIAGEQLSASDFMAVMLMRWSRNMPKPATTWPHLASYVERMRALPSFIELNRREGLSDWQNPG